MKKIIMLLLAQITVTGVLFAGEKYEFKIDCLKDSFMIGEPIFVKAYLKNIGDEKMIFNECFNAQIMLKNFEGKEIKMWSEITGMTMSTDINETLSPGETAEYTTMIYCDPYEQLYIDKPGKYFIEANAGADVENAGVIWWSNSIEVIVDEPVGRKNKKAQKLFVKNIRYLGYFQNTMIAPPELDMRTFNISSKRAIKKYEEFIRSTIKNFKKIKSGYSDTVWGKYADFFLLLNELRTEQALYANKVIAKYEKTSSISDMELFLNINKNFVLQDVALYNIAYLGLLNDSLSKEEKLGRAEQYLGMMRDSKCRHELRCISNRKSIESK
jgi:hypothetical protein